jgi:hypothetical protein
LLQRNLFTLIQGLNPKLKGYNTTELVHFLLTESIKKKMNKAKHASKKIDLLNGNMEELIEAKEKNIDKLNIFETRS